MSWYNSWQARKDARHFRRKRVEEVVSWVCLPVILVTGWLIYDQVRLAVERPDGARAASAIAAEAPAPGARQAVPLPPPAATPPGTTQRAAERTAPR